MPRIPFFPWHTRFDDSFGVGNDRDSADFVDASTDQLELNATGAPELCIELVHAYLTSDLQLPHESSGDPQQRTFDGLKVFCATHADVAGFIEYGTALRCPWLTDTGRLWLADYATWKGRRQIAKAAPGTIP